MRANGGLMNIYESLFPSINFNDKVCVVFKDGNQQEFTHLYYDNSVLNQLDWTDVVDCFEI